MEATVGFLGAGNMARAIIAGLLSANLIPPEKIWAVNRNNEEKLAELRAAFGIHAETNAVDRVALCDVIVLAIKPKDALEALRVMRELGARPRLVISIMAAVSTASIEAALGWAVPVVRAMPNTSVAVREGMTALAPGQYATQEDVREAQTFFDVLGEVEVVDESQLDAVTGVSGSGPAYVYRFVEALAKAGEVNGLAPEAALRLAVSTVVGAGAMLRNSGDDPAELRRQVTSPGGTTFAGLSAFEEQDLDGLLAEVVRRAKERSAQMQREYGSHLAGVTE